MKTHLDYNRCHLYSAGDKHFLVCEGILYIVNKLLLIQLLEEFQGKTPQENSENLIALVEKGTFKQIHI